MKLYGEVIPDRIEKLEEVMRFAANLCRSNGLSVSYLTSDAVVFDGTAWRRNPDKGEGSDPGVFVVEIQGHTFDEKWAVARIGNHGDWTLSSVIALSNRMTEVVNSESHG